MEKSIQRRFYKVAGPALVATTLLLSACRELQTATVPTPVISPLSATRTLQATRIADPALTIQPTSTLVPTITTQPTQIAESVEVTPTQEIMEKSIEKNEIVNGIIKFGGVEFSASNSGEKRWGPNNNLWDENNIQIDSEGHLHLQINPTRQDEWSCSEVLTTQSLGYGNYRVVIENMNDQVLKLDQNVVFGIFTWDNTSTDPGNKFNREIDFAEFARWGKPDDLPFGTVESTVQYGDNDEFKQFNIMPGQDELLFEMVWDEGRVHVTGPMLSNGKQMRFEYSGKKVPNPGDARFIFNLWLHNKDGEELEGLPPVNGKQQEVIIKDFEFSPL